MSILVAYFSATGTTARVGEKIARILDCDLYSIKPCHEYTQADLNWRDSHSRSSLEMNDAGARPEIIKDDLNTDGYDTIFLGFPKMEQGYICV